MLDRLPRSFRQVIDMRKSAGGPEYARVAQEAPESTFMSVLRRELCSNVEVDIASGLNQRLCADRIRQRLDRAKKIENPGGFGWRNQMTALVDRFNAAFAHRSPIEPVKGGYGGKELLKE